MRLVYARSRAGRQVSFDYMNQQLVWHGLTVRALWPRAGAADRAGAQEFLLYFVPMVNFEKVRSFFARIVRVPAVQCARRGAR